MSRFAGLKNDLQPTPPAPRPAAAQPEPSATQKKRPAREGKKGILGHFSPELSRALNMLAVEEGTTVQALMGESFDLLLRARGRHPFGER